MRGEKLEVWMRNWKKKNTSHAVCGWIFFFFFFFGQEWQLNSSFFVFFSEWLVSRSLPGEFEELPVDNFADILRQFYAEVRNRKGEPYGKSALINLRASIQRHISSPPYNRTLNIMKDRDFIPANHVLQGVLKTNRLQGRDKTQHKKPLEAEDMSRIDEVLDLSSPTGLQMRVFVDIMMHFGRRGREGLRDLKKRQLQCTAGCHWPWICLYCL